MINLEYISRITNAMNCCKNIGLSLIANERQGDILTLYKPDYIFEKQDQEVRYNLNKDANSQISDLKLSLKQSNRNWLELTDLEKMELQDIKAGITPASKEAEQILALYGEAPNMHLIKKYTPAYIASLNTNKNTFDYQMSLAHNPATSHTVVSFILPEWTRSAQLKVIDQYNQIGTIFQTVVIDLETNTTEINTAGLATGIYIINLVINGEVVEAESLVVLH